jgi:hypothetical protein
VATPEVFVVAFVALRVPHAVPAAVKSTGSPATIGVVVAVTVEVEVPLDWMLVGVAAPVSAVVVEAAVVLSITSVPDWGPDSPVWAVASVAVTVQKPFVTVPV